MALFPTTPILDPFTRTEAALGTTEANWAPTTFIATGGGGRLLQSSAAVNSALATQASGTQCGQVWQNNSYVLPVETYITLHAFATAGTHFSLYWLTNTTLATFNGYMMRGAITAPNWLIARYDAGNATTLNSGNTSVPANDLFGMSITANGLITAWQVHAGTPSVLGTAVDTTYVGSGFFALETNGGTGASFQGTNFGGGNLGPPGNTPPLLYGTSILRRNR